MANEQEASTKTSWEKKKTIGSCIFWVGVIVLVIGLCFLPVAMSGRDIGEGIGGVVVFIIGTVAGGILAVIGAIVFLIGKDQEIEQRNLNEADDSESDYNNEIDKP